MELQCTKWWNQLHQLLFPWCNKHILQRLVVLYCMSYSLLWLPEAFWFQTSSLCKFVEGLIQAIFWPSWHVPHNSDPPALGSLGVGLRVAWRIGAPFTLCGQLWSIFIRLERWPHSSPRGGGPNIWNNPTWGCEEKFLQLKPSAVETFQWRPWSEAWQTAEILGSFHTESASRKIKSRGRLSLLKPLYYIAIHT